MIKPSVPREINLLTGRKGSTYYENGLRYQAYLESRGVTAHLVETGGAFDNLKILLADTASLPQAAFAEAGMEAALSDTTGVGEVVTLGSVYLEPFWLFVTAATEAEDPSELGELELAVGPRGSVAPPVIRGLLRVSGIESDITLVLVAEVDDAATALRTGDAQAIFVAGLPGSPALDELIDSENLRLMSFRRAPAYALRHGHLKAIQLPEGVLDLARNLPGEDTQLLAGATNIVTREDLPPALVDVLLDAARVVHREPTLFSDRGEFPNATIVSLPVSREADRYYERGPSLLRRVLPFWLASLVERVAWAVATFAGALFAIFGLLPKLLNLRFQLTLGKLYRRLERIEKNPVGKERHALLEELEEVRRQSTGIRVPLGQDAPFFELRQNIHDLTDRTEQQTDGPA